MKFETNVYFFWNKIKHRFVWQQHTYTDLVQDFPIMYYNFRLLFWIQWYTPSWPHVSLFITFKQCCLRAQWLSTCILNTLIYFMCMFISLYTVNTVLLMKEVLFLVDASFMLNYNILSCNLLTLYWYCFECVTCIEMYICYCLKLWNTIKLVCKNIT